MIIEIVDSKSLSPDVFSELPSGETAIVKTQGIELHAECEKILPELTQVIPLVSIGDLHTYRVTVRGYRMATFIAIVTAWSRMDFDGAERLIEEVRASSGGW